MEYTHSPELDMLLALSDLIATKATRVPLWSEHLTPVQPAGSVGIYVNRWPEGVDSVTLADYPLTDDPSLSDSLVGVQVTIKSDRQDRVKAIAADVFDVVQGLWGVRRGGVTVVHAGRSSGTNLGQDSSEREMRSDNYQMTVNRPSPNRQ